ncbi:cupin-like domain-containing protein [Myxococcus sp. K15C18031901]|uniref:cupin-like domain-containing protein n=1 Tax=Myxococcus dinghuensis TaxID=2906761 RepID=UPI0020A7DF3A|nr:cupin-like domain-containing protein [Myxococcus dinghuensis]MCP3104975.1 cupin-like domain-containing protein [Myxococcus dinghuensis]
MTPDTFLELPPSLRAWVAENLSGGVEADILVGLLEATGVDGARARASVRAISAHPAVCHARREAGRRWEVESLLEARSALASQGQDAEPAEVERRRGLSPEGFFEEYYLRNRPVIVEGLLDDWPALTRWTPEWLVSRFGDEQVEVMAGRDAEPDPDFHAERLRRTLPLRELVARMLAEGESDDLYVVARNSLLLREAFRPLLEDVRPPRGYIHPDVHVPDSVHLWFGPAGTLSNLHHDHLNVFFCQVLGRKRFWLAPSWETPWLYNDRGLYSAVDIRAPDSRRHPDFARVALRSCVVGPGDALLIPVGWWHAVRALDLSVSVTFVNFDRPEPNTQWRNYWMGPRPEKVAR